MNSQSPFGTTTEAHSNQTTNIYFKEMIRRLANGIEAFDPNAVISVPINATRQDINNATIERLRVFMAKVDVMSATPEGWPPGTMYLRVCDTLVGGQQATTGDANQAQPALFKINEELISGQLVTTEAASRTQQDQKVEGLPVTSMLNNEQAAKASVKAPPNPAHFVLPHPVDSAAPEQTTIVDADCRWARAMASKYLVNAYLNYLSHWPSTTGTPRLAVEKATWAVLLDYPQFTFMDLASPDLQMGARKHNAVIQRHELIKCYGTEVESWIRVFKPDMFASTWPEVRNAMSPVENTCYPGAPSSRSTRFSSSEEMDKVWHVRLAQTSSNVEQHKTYKPISRDAAFKGGVEQVLREQERTPTMIAAELDRMDAQEVSQEAELKAGDETEQKTTIDAEKKAARDAAEKTRRQSEHKSRHEAALKAEALLKARKARREAHEAEMKALDKAEQNLKDAKEQAAKETEQDYSRHQAIWIHQHHLDMGSAEDYKRRSETRNTLMSRCKPLDHQNEKLLSGKAKVQHDLRAGMVIGETKQKAEEDFKRKIDAHEIRRQKEAEERRQVAAPKKPVESSSQAAARETQKSKAQPKEALQDTHDASLHRPIAIQLKATSAHVGMDRFGTRPQQPASASFKLAKDIQPQRDTGIHYKVNEAATPKHESAETHKYKALRAMDLHFKIQAHQEEANSIRGRIQAEKDLKAQQEAQVRANELQLQLQEQTESALKAPGVRQESRPTTWEEWKDLNAIDNGVGLKALTEQWSQIPAERENGALVQAQKDFDASTQAQKQSNVKTQAQKEMDVNKQAQVEDDARSQAQKRDAKIKTQKEKDAEIQHRKKMEAHWQAETAKVKAGVEALKDVDPAEIAIHALTQAMAEKRQACWRALQDRSDQGEAQRMKDQYICLKEKRETYLQAKETTAQAQARQENNPETPQLGAQNSQIEVSQSEEKNRCQTLVPAQGAAPEDPAQDLASRLCGDDKHARNNQVRIEAEKKGVARVRAHQDAVQQPQMSTKTAVGIGRDYQMNDSRLRDSSETHIWREIPGYGAVWTPVNQTQPKDYRQKQSSEQPSNSGNHQQQPISRLVRHSRPHKPMPPIAFPSNTPTRQRTALTEAQKDREMNDMISLREKSLQSQDKTEQAAIDKKDAERKASLERVAAEGKENQRLERLAAERKENQRLEDEVNAHGYDAPEDTYARPLLQQHDLERMTVRERACAQEEAVAQVDQHGGPWIPRPQLKVGQMKADYPNVSLREKNVHTMKELMDEHPKTQHPQAQHPQDQHPKGQQRNSKQPKVATEVKFKSHKTEKPKVESPKFEQPTVEHVEQPAAENPKVEQAKAPKIKVEQLQEIDINDAPLEDEDNFDWEVLEKSAELERASKTSFRTPDGQGRKPKSGNFFSKFAYGR